MYNIAFRELEEERVDKVNNFLLFFRRRKYTEILAALLRGSGGTGMYTFYVVYMSILLPWAHLFKIRLACYPRVKCLAYVPDSDLIETDLNCKFVTNKFFFLETLSSIL